MKAIQIQNLTKRYETLKGKMFKSNKGMQVDDILAVDDVSLEIEEGEIFGLVGANGAGKTTLIKCMLNLVSPTSGSCSIYGYDSVKQTQEMLYNVGAIVEEPTLFKNLSGYKNLKLLARLNGCVSEERIKQIVDLVGLTDRINSKFSTYSLGMKQRLGIAQAIIHSPKVLLLDEPINGFDPEGIIEIRNLLKTLAKEYKTTILISSHILSELESLCDRVGIMKDGKLVMVDTLENLQKGNEEVIIHIECTNVELAQEIVAKEFELPTKVIGSNLYIKASSSDQVSEISKILIQSGIEISSLNTKKKNLEEIYLEVAR